MFTLFKRRAWTEWLLSDVGRPKPCFTLHLPALFSKMKRGLFLCPITKDMAKTIHTILYDDVLDGSKIVTIDNCVCQLYDIKRDYDSIIKNGKNLSKPALYILLNRSRRKAYIGETDDFSQRIASHMLKKDFWNEALAFMANDNSLTTTEVRYLESLSYEVANACGIYDLSENTQVPKKPYVQAIQEYKIIEFFDYVKSGPYIKELGGLNCPSTNQKFYKMKNNFLYQNHIYLIILNLYNF